MDVITIEINPKTGMVEASFKGNSKLGSSLMFDVCEMLRNRKGAEHISTELTMRKGAI